MEFYYIWRTDGVRYQMIKPIIDDLETARKDVRWLRDNYPKLAYFITKLVTDRDAAESLMETYYIFYREKGRYKMFEIMDEVKRVKRVKRMPDIICARNMVKELRDEYPDKQFYITKEVRGI